MASRSPPVRSSSLALDALRMQALEKADAQWVRFQTPEPPEETHARETHPSYLFYMAVQEQCRLRSYSVNELLAYMGQVLSSNHKPIIKPWGHRVCSDIRSAYRGGEALTQENYMHIYQEGERMDDLHTLHGYFKYPGLEDVSLQRDVWTSLYALFFEDASQSFKNKFKLIYPEGALLFRLRYLQGAPLTSDDFERLERCTREIRELGLADVQPEETTRCLLWLLPLPDLKRFQVWLQGVAKPNGFYVGHTQNPFSHRQWLRCITRLYLDDYVHMQRVGLADRIQLGHTPDTMRLLPKALFDHCIAPLLGPHRGVALPPLPIDIRPPPPPPAPLAAAAAPAK